MRALFILMFLGPVVQAAPEPGCAPAEVAERVCFAFPSPSDGLIAEHFMDALAMCRAPDGQIAMRVRLPDGRMLSPTPTITTTRAGTITYTSHIVTTDFMLSFAPISDVSISNATFTILVNNGLISSRSLKCM